MIKANFNAYDSYVTDSLYQWDLNQVLTVTGLNLSVVPEVHFSNANMERTIVRQSAMVNHVVSVGIPNSLLQDPLTIYAHIGIYEGDKFKIVEKVEIPVIPKERPSDYQIQDSDEEIYSFNQVLNALANKADSAQVANIIAHNNDTEGNTELVDIRTDIAGNVHKSAGNAVRQQISNLDTLKFGLKTPTAYDANQCLATGFYMVRSGNDWTNLPADYSGGGALVTFDGNSDTRRYQQFYDYSGKVYYRNQKYGVFSEWSRIAFQTDVTTKINEHENSVEPVSMRFKPITPYLVNGVIDLDTITEIGVYTLSSGHTLNNSPARSGTLVVYKGANDYNVYQTVYDYYGLVYTRNMTLDKTFTEWKRLMFFNEKSVFNMNGTLIDGTDLDTVNANGYYFVSGSRTYTNLPENNAGGMLVIYWQDEYRWYQVYYSANTNLSYFRNYNNGVWSAWKRILTNADLSTIETKVSHKYSIKKVDDSIVNIYKRGSAGYIRYQYGRHTDDTINLDTWRLRYIHVCDLNMNTLKTISSIGADLEGVVLLEGDADHLGGVHGDEQFTEYFIFIDGKRYTFDTIVDMECEEIRFIVNSTITHMDSNNVCMTKNKQTTFDKDGVHIRCSWIPTEELKIKSIRACMFSIQKECITHYYDSNVYRTPIAVSEISDIQTDISTEKNLVDMYYMGMVSAHHWAGFRGGDASNYGTIIKDYGVRLKSYFNCYDNYTATIGEELIAENHFYVTY